MSPANYDWQAISTGIRPTIHAPDPLRRLPLIGNSDSRFQDIDAAAGKSLAMRPMAFQEFQNRDGKPKEQHAHHYA
jgi:hypothetical protein